MIRTISHLLKTIQIARRVFEPLSVDELGGQVPADS